MRTTSRFLISKTLKGLFSVCGAVILAARFAREMRIKPILIVIKTAMVFRNFGRLKV